MAKLFEKCDLCCNSKPKKQRERDINKHTFFLPLHFFTTVVFEWLKTYLVCHFHILYKLLK